MKDDPASVDDPDARDPHPAADGIDRELIKLLGELVAPEVGDDFDRGVADRLARATRRTRSRNLILFATALVVTFVAGWGAGSNFADRRGRAPEFSPQNDARESAPIATTVTRDEPIKNDGELVESNQPQPALDAVAVPDNLGVTSDALASVGLGPSSPSRAVDPHPGAIAVESPPTVERLPATTEVASVPPDSSPERAAPEPAVDSTSTTALDPPGATPAPAEHVEAAETAPPAAAHSLAEARRMRRLGRTSPSIEAAARAIDEAAAARDEKVQVDAVAFLVEILKLPVDNAPSGEVEVIKDSQLRHLAGRLTEELGRAVFIEGDVTREIGRIEIEPVGLARIARDPELADLVRDFMNRYPGRFRFKDR